MQTGSETLNSEPESMVASPDDDSASAELPGEPAQSLQAPVEDSASRKRVAVLVLATGQVEAATADALTELAIGVVAQRGGIAIVGKEEFQALLGQSEEGSIECVSSSACLGRIGVELGVDELIAGTLGRREQVWIFNLNRIDIRSGVLAGRAFKK